MASCSDDVDHACCAMFNIYVEKTTGQKTTGNPNDVTARSGAVMKLLKESNNFDTTTCQWIEGSLIPKVQDNATKKMMNKQFVSQFLPQLAAHVSKEKPEEKLAEIKQKIAHKHHELLNPGKQQDADVVKRLTNVKGYTGSHKQRFDAESGKGKGMEGRVDKTDGSGYVGAYKGAETYDKTH